MEASEPTIFDEAFSFLGVRQVEASRSRAHDFMTGADDQTPAMKEQPRDPANGERPPSPAASDGPHSDAAGEADAGIEPSGSEEGEEAAMEGKGKRRKLGTLRADESVVVKQARSVSCDIQGQQR